MKLALNAPPRVAFSLREVARPGELWRLFQTIAIDGSIARGWPPERYNREGCAFVMRSMRVVHARELAYGAALSAQTACIRIRREMFFTRRSRVLDAEGTVSATHQEWAVISSAVEPMRAPPELLASFGEDDDAAELPEVVLPAIARPHASTLEPLEHDALFCETDPLDHVNHTVYLDWCDGVVARELARRGLPPRELVARAEEATFRSAVAVGDRVRVESTLLGQTADGALVFDHEVRVGERVAATLRTVRALAGDPDGARLAAAFGVI